jgi:hypothetical protein
LSKADEQLASSVLGSPKKAGRRYRCGTCGLNWPVEELTPEQDEDGRRVGWICENCY